MEQEAHESASIAYVNKKFEDGCSSCDVRATVSSWRKWLLIGYGAVIIIQGLTLVGGGFFLKSVVRSALIEVLKENKDLRDYLAVERSK
jgi:hypothetical protein